MPQRIVYYGDLIPLVDFHNFVQLFPVCSPEYKLLLKGVYPANTQRRYNIVSTSLRRHDVAATSKQCYYDVVCLLGSFREISFQKGVKNLLRDLSHLKVWPFLLSSSEVNKEVTWTLDIWRTSIHSCTYTTNLWSLICRRYRICNK